MILESLTRAFDLVLTLDKGFFEILLLSMKVSFLSLFLSCLVGLPVGTYLAIKNFWGRNAILIIFNAMMGLPPVVVGLIVYLLISRSGPFGLVRYFVYTYSYDYCSNDFDYSYYSFINSSNN